MKTSGSKLFWIGFFLVLIDQVSKFLVKGNLDVGQSIVVFDWFLIYFVENNGFAFGYELLIVNGIITFLGLFIISKPMSGPFHLTE